jgi:acetyl esterase/lipase
MLRRQHLFPAVTLLGLCTSLHAAEPKVVDLWPNGAPGAKGSEAADTPRLTVHLPDLEKATGAAVVVCPGGGYRVLAKVKEGHDVARFFNSFGVAAYVLEYRLGPRYRHPAQLQDAQRAVRWVRAQAEKHGVDPRRVGLMGFSAGGHVTAMAGVTPGDGDPDAKDPVERQSARPDFLVLAYPKITWDAKADTGILKTFLGDDASDEKVRSINADQHVTDQTPPAFLFHTDEDRLSAENSVRFYLALRKHKVPAELHVYQKGPHGVGLAQDDPDLTTWKDHVRGWLRANGWLTAAKQVALKGTLAIDGKPLERGFITLTDVDGQRPTVRAAVAKGKYAFPDGQGPRIGRYQVAVTVFGDNDGKGPANDLGAYHVLTPERTKVWVEIADGVNELALDFKWREPDR